MAYDWLLLPANQSEAMDENSELTRILGWAFLSNPRLYHEFVLVIQPPGRHNR